MLFCSAFRVSSFLTSSVVCLVPDGGVGVAGLDCGLGAWVLVMVVFADASWWVFWLILLPEEIMFSSKSL